MLLGCFGAALYGAYPFLYGIAFGEVLHVSKHITLPYYYYGPPN